MKFRTPAKSHGISTIGHSVSVSGTVANSAFVWSDISGARGCKAPASVFRAPRNNVDHAVDGVRSPDRAAGSPNYFDPLNIFQQYVLYIPINASKKRGVNAAPIDQHQHRL